MSKLKTYLLRPRLGILFIDKKLYINTSIDNMNFKKILKSPKFVKKYLKSTINKIGKKKSIKVKGSL